MRLSHILRTKGSEVVTIDPDRTILEAAQTLVHHNIGSLIVMERGEPVGILTERDILRLTARGPHEVERARVVDVMTRDPVTALEDDPVAKAMDVMTRNRVRHLPVMRDDTLVGIVSIGDVVNAVSEEYQEENRHLRRYISGARSY